MEGWALFCILAVILLLVILLVYLLKQDPDDATPPMSGGYTPASVPVTPEKKRAPAKPTADEQSYYQFSSPALRQCAFCGCENETGAKQCQVCGKSL